jgi:hypothetical protein
MSKNFFKDGKWQDNPKEVTIVICECGAKYIKTREEQTACLRCFVKRKYD